MIEYLQNFWWLWWTPCDTRCNAYDSAGRTECHQHSHRLNHCTYLAQWQQCQHTLIVYELCLWGGLIDQSGKIFAYLPIASKWLSLATTVITTDYLITSKCCKLNQKKEVILEISLLGNHINMYIRTVVWEKFTIETVHGKTVCGKIFSSLEENDNFLTMNFYGQIWDQTFCSTD